MFWGVVAIVIPLATFSRRPLAPSRTQAGLSHVNRVARSDLLSLIFLLGCLWVTPAFTKPLPSTVLKYDVNHPGSVLHYISVVKYLFHYLKYIFETVTYWGLGLHQHPQFGREILNKFYMAFQGHNFFSMILL